jgi:hypothetical protein
VDAEDAFVVALDIQTAADLLNGVLFWEGLQFKRFELEGGGQWG